MTNFVDKIKEEINTLFNSECHPFITKGPLSSMYLDLNDLKFLTRRIPYIKEKFTFKDGKILKKIVSLT